MDMMFLVVSTLLYNIHGLESDVGVSFLKMVVVMFVQSCVCRVCSTVEGVVELAKGNAALRLSDLSQHLQVVLVAAARMLIPSIHYIMEKTRVRCSVVRACHCAACHPKPQSMFEPQDTSEKTHLATARGSLAVWCSRSLFAVMGIFLCVWGPRQSLLDDPFTSTLMWCEHDFMC